MALIGVGWPGSEHEDPPKESTLLNRIDTSGDGLVDSEEYMAAAEDAAKRFPERQRALAMFRRVLSAADIDGDGCLSEAELQYSEYLAKTVPKETIMGDEAEALDSDAPRWEPGDFGLPEVVEAMVSMDTDKDGKLDLEEFLPLMRSTLISAGWDWKVADCPRISKKLEAIFERADVTGVRLLGLRELQYAAFLMRELMVQDSMRGIYAEADENRDGVLDREEVVGRDREAGLDRLVRADLNDPGHTTLAEDLRDRFDEFDKNADSRLDKEEVEAYVRDWLAMLFPNYVVPLDWSFA